MTHDEIRTATVGAVNISQSPEGLQDQGNAH